MIPVTVTCRVKTGELMCAKITERGRWEAFLSCFPLNEEIVLGLAARNIAEGEVIDYFPNKNTKDVLTNATIGEVYA